MTFCQGFVKLRHTFCRFKALILVFTEEEVYFAILRYKYLLIKWARFQRISISVSDYLKAHLRVMALFKDHKSTSKQVHLLRSIVHIV